jgi:DNA mismatch endonuclease (patch repair protein)
MQATKGQDNPFEKALRSNLFRKGFRYRVHARLIEDSKRTVDIVFPRQRIAVFVDGCFWHGCPVHGTWPKNNAQWWRAKIESNRVRDRDTDKRLTDLGWIVIRVWGHEEVIVAVERVAAALLQGERHCWEAVAGSG